MNESTPALVRYKAYWVYGYCLPGSLGAPKYIARCTTPPEKRRPGHTASLDDKYLCFYTKEEAVSAAVKARAAYLAYVDAQFPDRDTSKDARYFVRIMTYITDNRRNAEDICLLRGPSGELLLAGNDGCDLTYI